MRRTICFTLFGLLVSSGAAFPQARAGQGPLARPRGRVVFVRWAARPAAFLRYGTFCPFPYPVPYPVWNFIASSPAYVFAGTISESHPQLVFKDGTTYTVTDYWRIDDQLHFITTEEAERSLCRTLCRSATLMCNGRLMRMKWEGFGSW